MDPTTNGSSVVVSDIKSDGTYVIPVNEFIRNHVIEDGGSVELGLLHNMLGNTDTPEDHVRVIMVPTEVGMEKLFKSGKLKRRNFEPGDTTKITETLRGVFDLTDGSVPSKWNSNTIPFHNKLKHPVTLRLDNAKKRIVGVSTHPSRPDIVVTFFHRRVHSGIVVYFVYIDGLLLTNSLRRKMM